MQLGIHNRPHYRARVSNSGSILASGFNYSDLGVEQIGFFNETLDGNAPVSVQVPTHATAKKVKIAIGRAKTSADNSKRAGFSQFPYSTETFSAKDIVSWKGIKANNNSSTDIWSFGYDGVDASKRIVTKLDHRDYVVSMRLWGNPIMKLTTRPYLLRQYFIDKGCFEGTEDQYVQDEKIIDSLIKQIKNDSFSTPQQNLDRFVKVTKIKKCLPAAAALTGLITFTEFSISLCDDGSSSSLGQLQTQYPGFKVEVDSRSGATSTYKMLRPNTAGAPAVASISRPVALAVCSVCPTGYTLSAPKKVFTVQRPLAGTETLTTNALRQTYATAISTAYGATSGTFISNTDGIATVALYTPLAANNLVALLADVVTIEIQTGQFCVPPAGTTTAWTSGATCTKAPKEYMLTLGDTDCGTTRLLELQNKYGYLVVSEVSAGTCARVYKTTTFSECIAPGCYPESYVFSAPSDFDYHTKWVEFAAPLANPNCDVATVDAPCCAVGAIFETASFYNNFADCLYGYYDFDPTDVDPVYMEISMHSQDFGGSNCLLQDAPVTKLRGVTFQRGTGDWVKEMEATTMHYDTGMVASSHVGRNVAYGLTNFSAKNDVFYDEYQLTIESKIDPSSVLGSMNRSNRVTYAYFFPVTKGKDFEIAVNSLIASVDSELSPVVLY